MDIEKEPHHYEFLEESMTFWLEKCDVFKMIFCTESDVFKLKRRLYVSYGISHNSSQIFDENVKFLRFKKT